MWLPISNRPREKSYFLCRFLQSSTFVQNSHFTGRDMIGESKRRHAGSLTDGRQDKIRGSQRLIYLRTGPSFSVLRRRIWVHLSCEGCQLVPRSYTLHQTRLNFTHTQHQRKEPVWKQEEKKLPYSWIWCPVRGLSNETSWKEYVMYRGFRKLYTSGQPRDLEWL